MVTKKKVVHKAQVIEASEVHVTVGAPAVSVVSSDAHLLPGEKIDFSKPMPVVHSSK